MTDERAMELLNAYADGELTGEERLAVEAELQVNAAARATLNEIRNQKAILRGTYVGILREAIPDRLTGVLARPMPRYFNPWLAMAASLALLLVGSLAGWFAGQWDHGNSADGIARRAIVAHTVYSGENRHVVEVAAAEQEHLQSWLSKRVGTPFNIPDLSAQGYHLLGGRLLAAEDRPAGQLMYENDAKKRLSVFITTFNEAKAADLKIVRKGAVIACYWLDGTMGLAVAGDMDEKSMMVLGHSVYDQMEEPDPV